MTTSGVLPHRASRYGLISCSGFVNVVSLETYEARCRPITRYSADPAILQSEQTVSIDALKSNEATSGPNIEASSFPSIDLDALKMGMELLRLFSGQSQSEPQYEPIKLISVPKSHKPKSRTHAASICGPRPVHIITERALQHWLSVAERRPIVGRVGKTDNSKPVLVIRSDKEDIPSHFHCMLPLESRDRLSSRPYFFQSTQNCLSMLTHRVKHWRRGE